MSIELKKAAAEIVLRELSEVEKRSASGGAWPKVEVGPIQPHPTPPPPNEQH